MPEEPPGECEADDVAASEAEDEVEVGKEIILLAGAGQPGDAGGADEPGDAGADEPGDAGADAAGADEPETAAGADAPQMAAEDTRTKLLERLIAIRLIYGRGPPAAAAEPSAASHAPGEVAAAAALEGDAVG